MIRREQRGDGLIVRPVRGRRDLRSFIDLPYRLHAGDPVWVPPLRIEVRASLSRKKNPFFDHGEADYFLAERSGAVVGRIAAVSNRLHNETHQDTVGFFGFFESINDPDVANELLRVAADWNRERGHRELRGPASFSTNEQCGLLVDGFDSPPTLMMPHNPPYYVELLEQAGFEKAKDLWVYRVGDPPLEALKRAERAARLIARRTGVTLRPVEMANFRGELGLIETLYNRVWERNWGFVPLTEREISHMAAELKPVVVPDLVPIAEKDGEVIGFGLAVPDVNQVLLANRSGRLLPGVLRILWALRRKRFRRIRILLLGLLPEFRGKGIDMMIYHWIWSRGLDHGFRWAEAGWILEDNATMKSALQRLTFEPYKTYRMYERSITGSAVHSVSPKCDQTDAGPT